MLRSSRPAGPVDTGLTGGSKGKQIFSVDDLAIGVDSKQKVSENKRGLSVLESDLRPLLASEDVSVATVAYVPNALAGKYAGYLYLLATTDGPVLRVPGIIGDGNDEVEPDSASAEALIGRPIGPWVLSADGWYAEIK